MRCDHIAKREGNRRLAGVGNRDPRIPYRHLFDKLGRSRYVS